jgi:hypothetical protein
MNDARVAHSRPGGAVGDDLEQFAILELPRRNALLLALKIGTGIELEPKDSVAFGSDGELPRGTAIIAFQQRAAY